MRYAIVDAQGKVINVVLWDGGNDWSPPEGTTAVQDNNAVIGGTIISGVYTPPPVAPPSQDELDAAAKRIAREARHVLILGQTEVADLVLQMKTATSAQRGAWIDNHVTNLAEARNVLKLLVEIIATQID